MFELAELAALFVCFVIGMWVVSISCTKRIEFLEKELKDCQHHNAGLAHNNATLTKERNSLAAGGQVIVAAQRTFEGQIKAKDEQIAYWQSMSNKYSMILDDRQRAFRNRGAELVTLRNELNWKLSSLNEVTSVVHEANKKWWIDLKTGEPIQRNKAEAIALMHSELSEALEGIRKDAMDDKLPHRKAEEVELADCVIRIFDYCGGFKLDLQGAFEEKMAYNATRIDHTPEHRAAPGGKKI